MRQEVHDLKYMDLLVRNFNPTTVPGQPPKVLRVARPVPVLTRGYGATGLMCVDLVSVLSPLCPTRARGCMLLPGR
eukprot:2090808-Rhodomonas_salina.1